MLNDKTYTILKWIAQILLPALETLWLAIAGIWSLPLAVPIGATVAAIDLFLGALLGVSTAAYNKAQGK